MADRPGLADIARETWPGSVATCAVSGNDAADYATLVWAPGTSGKAKPTLAEFTAARATVEAAMATQEKARRRVDRLTTNEQDAIVRALFILADGLDTLHAALRANNTVFLNNTKPTLTGLGTLKTRLQDILNNTE